MGEAPLVMKIISLKVQLKSNCTKEKNHTHNLTGHGMHTPSCVCMRPRSLMTDNYYQNSHAR